MNIPANILAVLKKPQSYLTHAHLRPDPDSLGSVLAFKLGMESLGSVVNVFCEDDLPYSDLFLPEAENINHMYLSDAVASFSYDHYICFDTAKWGLATHREPIPQLKQPVINIDHHPDNQIKTSLSWIAPEVPCAAGLVYELLVALDVDITADIATCLIYGIMGDTSIFQNFNTTPEIIKLSSDLVSKGGDYQACVSAITRSYTHDQLKAYGIMLNNLKISTDKDFVYTTLGFEEWSQFDPRTDIGNFSNQFCGRVEGTLFGASLVEKEEGITKGSIRSRLPDVDVAQIAHLINGGGHKNAAGFRIEKPLKKAEIDFLNAIAHLKSKGKL